MSCETTKVYKCDMCGAVIDTHDDAVMRNSVISNGIYCVLMLVHNPIYDEEYRTRIERASIDLCPSCADRATMIHCEVITANDRQSCHYEYSWRGDAR